MTWGHGLEGPLVGHYFFGGGRVLAELAAMRGWDEGYVEVDGCLRDAGSGEVVGLREAVPAGA